MQQMKPLNQRRGQQAYRVSNNPNPMYVLHTICALLYFFEMLLLLALIVFYHNNLQPLG